MLGVEAVALPESGRHIRGRRGFAVRSTRAARRRATVGQQCLCRLKRERTTVAGASDLCLHRILPTHSFVGHSPTCQEYAKWNRLDYTSSLISGGYMDKVGAFEAKTHLPELLRRVEGGESITITKHGKPVAMLIPPTKLAGDVKAAIKAMREFRDRHGPKLGDISIRELIEEGRRY